VRPVPFSPAPDPVAVSFCPGREFEIELMSRSEEKETPESVIWDYSTALAMFGITFMGALWLLSPSRFVTRMSQVRIRPAPGATASETIGMGKGEKIVVRMHHGGHLMMWGKAAEPREVPVENVKIRFIGSRACQSLYWHSGYSEGRGTQVTDDRQNDLPTSR
jgi:hypothetical protein